MKGILPFSVERRMQTEPPVDLLRYQVYCPSCDSTYEPAIKSSTWWKAHQRAEKGYLDALWVDGDECGCSRSFRQELPKIPVGGYGIIGYTMDCQDFVIPCKTFVQLCAAAKKMKNCDTFWIIGVSQKVKDKLSGWF